MDIAQIDIAKVEITPSPAVAELVELQKLLDISNNRRMWKDVLRDLADSREPRKIVLRGVVEAKLASMPVIRALETLRAEQRTIEINSDLRWITMMEAREEGASWDEIAEAVEMIGNHAGEITRGWYAARVDEWEKRGTELELVAAYVARARAVLDDPSPADADVPASAEVPVDVQPGDDAEVRDQSAGPQVAAES